MPRVNLISRPILFEELLVKIVRIPMEIFSRIPIGHAYLQTEKPWYRYKVIYMYIR